MEEQIFYTRPLPYQHFKSFLQRPHFTFFINEGLDNHPYDSAGIIKCDRQIDNFKTCKIKLTPKMFVKYKKVNQIELVTYSN